MKIVLSGKLRILTIINSLICSGLIVLATWVSVSGQESAELADVRQSKPTETKTTNSTLEDQSKIKVTFDENSPGVVIIESNGEKVRVDTTKKIVEQIASNEENVSSQNTVAKTTKQESEKEESAYDFDRGEEPYDYRIVNIPTPKNVPKGSWNLTFTHRFSEKLHPLSDSAKDLFGLDSFGIASFGVSYGVTDKLYLSAYRSPLCQRGLCRVIEIGAGYNWIAMDKETPFGLTTYASIEGNDNFTEEYTYNLQTMISGRLGKRVHLFFSPAVHINSNGQRRFDPRPTDFFPPVILADSYRQPRHGASFGFGTSVLVTPNVAVLFDFTPRTGFKLGRVRTILDSSLHIVGFRTESHPTIGFGVQRNVGKHSFTLTLSNTQATTTSRYNSSNLLFEPKPKNVVIGFNLSRRF